ncbi:molybdopterin-guanine dinucleotide biosynthesis protein [Pseudarthrobacter siccitolerans]|uniref:Molybdopterin-guanine dinucleotide biosynthesis protein n=2 Tax=Pseudarthrobacter siccitolerans TaxID=861266 RepID=A0A024H695_9MICC|nr:molybdopterin-guanine dinucleotide biosynthesis protein [Pseudarthrobacter siccitolerans]
MSAPEAASRRATLMKEQTMAVSDEEAQVLEQWSNRLAQALQILDLKVDNELLLDLARRSADSIIHPAAPVTTFLVGYAAGLEAGTGSAGSREASSAAVQRAASVAFGLCEDGHDGGPASQGWADTAQ